jgi:hypothetical protein
MSFVAIHFRGFEQRHRLSARGVNIGIIERKPVVSLVTDGNAQ